MQFSALSLVLIPLCFGYAIIRYRLMDVDIIFNAVWRIRRRLRRWPRSFSACLR